MYILLLRAISKTFKGLYTDGGYLSQEIGGGLNAVESMNILEKVKEMFHFFLKKYTFRFQFGPDIFLLVAACLT